MGIIGRNGAGKSTLLKIINRITAPTAGRIELGGRVGSLLEVGTGFHPELTGRENVYLNGTLLGMRRTGDRCSASTPSSTSPEPRRFLDTQVKRYSTGMYIRLAFAVAAHLDSEILVVDEVLAVGDSDFQAKCLRKMREVARDGRTVLVVSHQLQTVSDLCSSALYLECRPPHAPRHGGRRRSRSTSAASPATRPVLKEAIHRPGTGEIRFTAVERGPRHHQAGPGGGGGVHGGGQPRLRQPLPRLLLRQQRGRHGHRPVRLAGGRLLAGPGHRERRPAPAYARRGSSQGPTPSTSSSTPVGTPTDIWEQACHFQVLPVTPYPHPTTPDGTDRGVVFPDFDYSQS